MKDSMRDSTKKNATTQSDDNQPKGNRPIELKPKVLEVVEIKPPTGAGDDHDAKINYKQTTNIYIRAYGIEFNYQAKKEMEFKDRTPLYSAMFVIFTLLPLGVGSYLHLV